MPARLCQSSQRVRADFRERTVPNGSLRMKGAYSTTPDTTARSAARELGVEVYARDDFLDAQAGSEEAVKAQLALAERIARETGYVVAIGHPRKETLNVLGPWLTTAPARGFDLVYASALKGIHKAAKPKTVAAAPTLRL